jgi:hypothetical protein
MTEQLQDQWDEHLINVLAAELFPHCAGNLARARKIICGLERRMEQMLSGEVQQRTLRVVGSDDSAS